MRDPIGGILNAASNFDAQFPSSSDDAKPFWEFNFTESFQAKQALKGSFSCRIIIRHGRSRFLHYENTPTRALSRTYYLE
ncbi:hypothetical protein TNCV_4459201 [Trichonephila clavipes]|nr:hypothetical protein TNCV_4459201 [Trichonephila clavipes]